MSTNSEIKDEQEYKNSIVRIRLSLSGIEWAGLEKQFGYMVWPGNDSLLNWDCLMYLRVIVSEIGIRQ